MIHSDVLGLYVPRFSFKLRLSINCPLPSCRCPKCVAGAVNSELCCTHNKSVNMSLQEVNINSLLYYFAKPWPVLCFCYLRPFHEGRANTVIREKYRLAQMNSFTRTWVHALSAVEGYHPKVKSHALLRMVRYGELCTTDYVTIPHSHNMFRLVGTTSSVVIHAHRPASLFLWWGVIFVDCRSFLRVGSVCCFQVYPDPLVR